MTFGQRKMKEILDAMAMQGLTPTPEQLQYLESTAIKLDNLYDQIKVNELSHGDPNLRIKRD